MTELLREEEEPMRITLAVALSTLFGEFAFADTVSDMVEARENGQIVGTSEICGYTLNADKVAAYVSERLAGMDPLARSSFQTGSGAHKMRLMEMGELERKVSCATQAKVAAKYGFMP
ncbi:hypothetical protein [Rhizobium sp. TRM95796]|uniref:hypothetical protein n=1 Tax=Rhizobium sp. TRM95796 TaxID=2979862 RepID=UPI0021E96222|nr:hypothetical protein [Rhizobium sp. TRM95796]MCV3764044.1 hypothetical protein [Rhizobium sp. TRM95796]